MKEINTTLIIFLFTVICILMIGITILTIKADEQPCILPRNDAQMLGGYESN